MENDHKPYSQEILSNSNYAVWKWQLGSLLKAKGLYEVATTGQPKKGDEAKFEEKKNQAHALIASTLHVDTTNKMKVLNCKDGYEIWMRLQNIYENKTSFEKQNLLGKLHTYKITSVRKVSESLAEINTLAAKLTALGVPITDEIQMSVIINALPSNFKTFIGSWSLMNEDDRSLNNLLTHVEAIAESEEVEDNQAYLMRNQKSRKFNNFRRKKINQPTEKKSNNRNNNCYVCNKPGHWAKDCFKNKQRNQTSSDPRNTDRQKRSDKQNNRQVDYRNVSFMARESEAEIVSNWIVDSGSTCHMTSHREWLNNYEEFTEDKKIRLGDDYTILARGSGIIYTKIGRLTNVYYVPEITENLFSVIAATRNGVTGLFDHDEIVFKLGKFELTRAHNDRGVYTMMLTIEKRPEGAMRAATIDEWHERLGHVSKETIKRMLDLNAVDGLKIANESTANCKDCALGKCHKTTHPTRKSKRAEKAGAVLHLDTVGPINVDSLSGARYWLLCKDEYSRYRQVSCVVDKSCITLEVKRMINQTKLETGNSVLKIVTDNGTEFVNREMKAFLNGKGIIHEKSVPYAHEQNGFIERDVRTVTEAARTMLNKSKLTKQLWAEAVHTAVYLLNRTLNSKATRVPYEEWFGRKPNIDNLLTFGQKVVIYNPEEKRRGWSCKFDNRGSEKYFVGYTDKYNTFRVYDYETGRVTIECDVTPIQNTVVKTRNDNTVDLDDSDDEDMEIDVVGGTDKPDDSSPSLSDDKAVKTASEYNSVTSGKSAEENQTYRPRSSTLKEHIETSIEQGSSRENSFARNLMDKIPGNLFIHKRPPQVTEERLRKKTRIDYQQDSNIHNRKQDKDSDYHAKISVVQDGNDPESFEEAINCQDKELWLKAMNEELDSLAKNDVWELVDRPKGNIVSNKWVLKTKRKADGTIERYKARLVARGFSQIYGKDYHETYAPVANMVSVRLLLAYAAVENMCLAMFDVKTAFLYGQLEEEIHME